MSFINQNIRLVGGSWERGTFPLCHQDQDRMATSDLGKWMVDRKNLNQLYINYTCLHGALSHICSTSVQEINRTWACFQN